MLERIVDTLSDADAARLAILHTRALPGSLVARLGLGYAQAFHRFCAASAHEDLRVWRAPDGSIHAACLVSARPGDLSARLRAATPLLSAALTHPAAWPDLLRAAIAPSVAAPAPQILLLFADEAARGRGLGRALVDAAAANAPFLCTITEDDPANRALAFYRKAGFADAGPTRVHGRAFRLLTRGATTEDGRCAG